MRRSSITLVLALFAGTALGASQENAVDVPGAVIRPVAPAENRTPPRPLEPEQLARLVADAQIGLGGPAVKPAPPVLTLNRGVTEAIPIGLHHLNRFRTPFRELRIETTSEAQIKKEGGSFYVATDGPEAVALFLIDKNNADNAVSLLLKPYELPPADVRLEVPWATMTPPAPSSDREGSWDTRQPYVASLSHLFRGLALRQVPAGYRIETVSDHSASTLPCDLAGVRIELKQRIEGSALFALVARVSNPGVTSVTIDESACAGPNVLAAAAWPLTLLEPGDETELFVALRTVEPAPPSTRPSVLHLPSR